MRYALTIAAVLLSVSAGVASAAPADDFIIVSVKPRSADVKPEIMTMSAKSEHRTSSTQEKRSDAATAAKVVAQRDVPASEQDYNDN